MGASPPIIKALPEEVVHKIAAGEVVERPVSVVKELVENALDAGATEITVEVLKGGMEDITVTDNGHGIEGKQMPLALKRHATSKIHRAEDLYSLSTLGFRGEALPSIASVSRFRLESATEGSEPLGYGLEVKEGQVGPLQELPMTQGARVKVKHLFCTTPARLKFLKRPETEWSHIADLMMAFALSRLDVQWRVTHNGKTFLFAPATDELKKRILDLFGKQTAENLYPLEREVSEIGLWGLVGHPNFSKRSNRHLYTFINGRYIQDRVVNHAIVHGYRNLLMTQQYPMAILHINIAPALVDVNVHPSKKEVKFANSNAIHHLISETVQQTLESAPWVQNQTQSSTDPMDGSCHGTVPSAVQLGRRGDKPHTTPPSDPLIPGNALLPKERIQGALEGFRDRVLSGDKIVTKDSAKIGSLGFSSLRLIGQFNLTYIICESEGSLILIDQHAAHERIGFEQFKRSFEANGLSQQRLLTPLSFDLPPHEAERLRSCLTELERFALVLDEFGENSFVLKAHPALLKDCDWQSLIRAILDQVLPEQRVGAVEAKIDHVLATMACHRQIRAGDRLLKEEMVDLLRQLEGTPRSYHCPHGRPVMVEIENREIEKWFKRIL